MIFTLMILEGYLKLCLHTKETNKSIALNIWRVIIHAFMGLIIA